MKKLLALALSALLSPAVSVAAELGEAPRVETPLETTSAVLTPLSVTPSALLPQVAPPTTISIPTAQTTQAQAPVTAQTSLTQTAAALDGKADAQALTARFDGTAKLATGLTAAGLVLAATPAAPVLSLTPAIPAAYSTWRLARTPKAERWSTSDAGRGWRGRAETVASVGTAAFATAFLLLVAHGILGGGPAFGAVAGLGALMIGEGARELVSHNRGEDIQRWQASHDQKYRVDPGTGKLRDVRGQKYGQLSDRFVERVPGRLSGIEIAALRVIGVGVALGVAHAFGAPASTLLLINAVSALGFAVSDHLPQKDYGATQDQPDR